MNLFSTICYNFQICAGYEVTPVILKELVVLFMYCQDLLQRLTDEI